jgi:RNA polymerase sigma-70 factor (ECF subfamily)
MIGVAALAEIGFPGSFVWRRMADVIFKGEASSAGQMERREREKFGRLVEIHKRSVYGLCLRLLGSADEAADAAQEAFTRAYASRSTFDRVLPFAPWVLRIARNHCLDLLRRRAPASSGVDLGAESTEGDRTELADPGALRGDESLERSELSVALQAAVTALPASYREVIHLFHVEQMGYREIAEVMEVPIGTVMTWLHRARAQLRAALAEKGLTP